MSIKIWHGIYNIFSGKYYNKSGYWDDETREYFPMCNKLRKYLSKKGVKFYRKYGIEHIQFTLGIDPEEDIEIISIYHSHFDDYNDQIGENVVIGRIKRMRGDVQKIIYEKEEYEVQIKLYDKENDDGDIETVYKTITKTRPKLNVYGDPIIKRTIYFKPYNLSKKYPDIKHKDGTITYGKLMYPYIYKMEGKL